MSKLQEKNNELTNIKNTLQNKLEEQSKAIYVSQNYNKVDPSSFNDELSFLLNDFNNIDIPAASFNGYNIIKTQSELNSVLSEASNMKNIYNPGDIVTQPSSFGITQNNICYRNGRQPIIPSKHFLKQYPNCMVCSVENPQTLLNSDTWADTKTNISQVCLYNPTAESTSGIPNLQMCQEFCNIPSNGLSSSTNSSTLSEFTNPFPNPINSSSMTYKNSNVMPTTEVINGENKSNK